MLFHNRQDAGRRLVERLLPLKSQSNVLVLGIPRGGVVVAAEVAKVLAAPLDIFIAHKIGAPSNPELAIGALTSTGDIILDHQLIGELKLPPAEIEAQVEYERREVARRLELFRHGCAPLEIAGKNIVLVDDGIATGSTVLAALQALRKQHPAALNLAIPVGPADVMQRLSHACDQMVVLSTPEPFWAVGRFYADFQQITDQQVIDLLNCQHREP